MPTNDLSPAAEAFLRQHTHNSPPERKRALEALAALLETVRAEERAAHAAAEEHVGKLQAALYCFLDLLEQGYPLRADDTGELSPEFAEALREGWEAMGGREGERAAREGQIAALLETVRAEAAPRWTACAEGLPAPMTRVLVWQGAAAKIGWLDEYRIWHFEPGPTFQAVLAWQPLPPGPEEEGGDG